MLISTRSYVHDITFISNETEVVYFSCDSI